MAKDAMTSDYTATELAEIHGRVLDATLERAVAGLEQETGRAWSSAARDVLRGILQARFAADHALDAQRIVGVERERLKAIIGPGPGGDVEGLDEATLRRIVFKTLDEIRSRAPAPRTNASRMNWVGRAQEAVVLCALWTACGLVVVGMALGVSLGLLEQFGVRVQYDWTQVWLTLGVAGGAAKAGWHRFRLTERG
jgi:hypothetical protein